MKIPVVLAVMLVYATAEEDSHPDVENWVDYRLYSGYRHVQQTPIAPKCTYEGYSCGGCKDVYLCSKPTGKWQIRWMFECDENKTCKDGWCIDTPNPGCTSDESEENDENDENVFECVSLEGMYPDPKSCTTFYHCIIDGGVLRKFEKSCGTNSKYGYNPRTTYCDVPLIDNKCGQSSVPLCSKPGQTGALEANPTIYYICQALHTNVLYPYLYVCPNGSKYNGNFQCIPN